MAEVPFADAAQRRKQVVDLHRLGEEFLSPNYSYLREFLDLRGYLSC
jgi:hypothetical protein